MNIIIVIFTKVWITGEPYWESASKKYIRVIKKVDDRNYAMDMGSSDNNARQYPTNVFAKIGENPARIAKWTSPSRSNEIDTFCTFLPNKCYQEKDCTELIDNENNTLEFNAIKEDQIYTVPSEVTIIKALLWGQVLMDVI